MNLPTVTSVFSHQRGVVIPSGQGFGLTTKPKPIAASPICLSTSGRAFPPETLLLRFGGLINKDYSVGIRQDAEIDEQRVTILLRDLLLRNLIKTGEGDRSTLKLFLDPGFINPSNFTIQGAMADLFHLIDRPIDVIVKANCGYDGIQTLLSATGTRYIYPGAELYLGPTLIYQSDSTVKGLKVSQRLYKDYVNSLKSLIVEKAGMHDPEQLRKSLQDSKPINALQALWYGEKGLVDAVLVGHDKVITREDLQKYYKKRRFSPQQIEEFNRSRDNIRKIPPSLVLDKYAPQSIPLVPRSSYEPLNVATQRKLSGAPVFYAGSLGDIAPVGKLALHSNINNSLELSRLVAANLPKSGLNSTLYRDAIFFDGEFNSDNIHQLTQMLEFLDEKKQMTSAHAEKASNIALVVNSPGGDVSMARELKDQIASMITPTDVIVHGEAASCGVLLLCSATGNRFATPSARMMIHAPWYSGGELVSGETMSDSVGLLEQCASDCANTIHQATDRGQRQVHEDMGGADLWLSSLESLFYGSKGLIDGILVGGNRVITRHMVEEYLLESFNGNRKAVEDYVKRKIARKSNPEEGKPTKNPADTPDPFGESLATIRLLADTRSKPLSEIDRFKVSMPSIGTKTIDYCHVLPVVSSKSEGGD